MPVAAGALDVILVRVGLRTADIGEALSARMGWSAAEASALIKRVADGEPTLILRGASQQDARMLVSDLRSRGAAARMTASTSRADEMDERAAARAPNPKSDEIQEEGRRPPDGAIEEGRVRRRAHGRAYKSAALVAFGVAVVVIFVINVTYQPSHGVLSKRAATASATSIVPVAAAPVSVSTNFFPPTTVHLPWPKTIADTTCEEWVNTLAESDRYGLASIVLHNIWRAHGLYIDPEPARIADFESDVTATCNSPAWFSGPAALADNIVTVMREVQKDNWLKYLGTPPS